MHEANTVLVTGSSRGIGLAVARKFALCNHRVVFNGLRHGAQMRAAVEALREKNPLLYGIEADVSDYEQAKIFFAAARQRFGPVDVLINNAAAGYFGLFQEMTPMEWERLIQTNLYSVFNCCRLAIPEMLSRKKGVIINISSVWGTAGASCEAVYAASKGAVNAFTKSLAKELGPSGIRVNAIACGAVDTEMNDRLSPDEKDAVAQTIPLMRFGQPDEVAELAFYMASAKAAYLTGQVVGLDGGWI